MNGFLCINKPTDMTSRDAVNRVQRLVKPSKVGHAGTLDPLATGVLVIAVGKATRIVPYVQQLPKTYLATFELGKTSDTEDITGDVTEHEVPRPPNRSDVEEVLPDFVGEIQQRPPAFSALRVNGKRAYDLARQGKEVQLKSRLITVHDIQLLHYEWPVLKLNVLCGSGTYIRSLGRDIGEQLGCGALMTALQRTAIGNFHIDHAMPTEFADKSAVETSLLPALDGLQSLPSVVVSESDVTTLSFGQSIRLSCTQELPAEVAAVDEAGELVAVLTKKAGTYRPAINFVAK